MKRIIKKDYILFDWIGSFLKSQWSQILTIIIAILAYSEDSLVFKFFPKDKFKVFSSVAFVSHLDGAFGYRLQTFNTNSRDSLKVVTPISMILRINIGNVSKEEQTIIGLALECQDSTSVWQQLNCMQTDSGVYIPIGNDSISLMKIQESNFISTLGLTPIKSNEIKYGFIAVESKAFQKNKHTRPRRFRLKLQLALGEIEYAEFESLKPSEKNFKQLSGLVIQSGNKKVSLKDCSFAPEVEVPDSVYTPPNSRN